MIPPAPHNTRAIGDHITTTHLTRHKLVKAEYMHVSMHARPDNAHAVSIMTAPRAPSTAWKAVITLQAFAEDEWHALFQLLHILDDVHLTNPPEVRECLRAWKAGGLEWEQQPMGARGKKPRKARTLWTKPDGTTMHIYKSTGKPHADPNCPCQYCSPPPPPPEEDPAP